MIIIRVNKKKLIEAKTYGDWDTENWTEGFKTGNLKFVIFPESNKVVVKDIDTDAVVYEASSPEDYEYTLADLFIGRKAIIDIEVIG